MKKFNTFMTENEILQFIQLKAIEMLSCLDEIKL
jgi:hypothetical protein